jgi:hypothetical protein
VSKPTRPKPRQAKRPRATAQQAAGKGNDASHSGNEPRERAEPEIVDTPQGRMVRAPAGQLIPEAEFVAMTTPPVPPSDEQLEAERQRLGLGKPIPREVMRTLDRDIVDFHFNPDHPLRQPTFDERVIAAGADGYSRRREAETLMFEQIAAAMRAGASRPSSIPAVGGLSTVHVVVAVEIGSDWLDRVFGRRATGVRSRWNVAVSKVLYSIAVFHPEKAAKLAEHPKEIRTAIRAWRRGAGRPRKGEYQGSKWDAIDTLCEFVGIPEHDKAAIEKAWQRSETK